MRDHFEGIIDLDQRATTHSGFINLSPLDVTGIDNPGIFPNHLGLVNVAESPVVVSLLLKIGEGARSIGVVNRTSCETGVEKADIEAIGNGSGIAESQILLNTGIGKPLTMDLNREIGKRKAGWLFDRKELHIVRRRERLSNDRFGIVVSADRKDQNTRRLEPEHLPVKKESCGKVLLITIIKVSGNQNKVDLFLESAIDKIHESTARRPTDLFHGCTLMSRETPERAIQMKVCRVNKGEHRTPQNWREGIDRSSEE
tara:strand:- start:2163 stop:2933 length:771 start_codon:yes stop_codon:yes gene_type:complete